MILPLLLACVDGAKEDAEDTAALDDTAQADSAQEETGDPAEVPPCTPWLPWDVAGATWSYVDADGTLLQTATALGEVDWEYGRDYALAWEDYASDGTTYASLSYLSCEADGIALVGSDVRYEGLQFVTWIDPPAVWMVREPAVGVAWVADSEALMDTYDDSGAHVERSSAFITWEAEVVAEAEVTVPAGTFPVVEVDFSGQRMSYGLDVGMVSMEGSMVLDTYAGTVP